MKFDNLAEKDRLQEKNNFKYENGGDKSDCYIVDLENICNGGVDKLEQSINSSTITTNSRITVSFLFFFNLFSSKYGQEYYYSLEFFESIAYW